MVNQQKIVIDLVLLGSEKATKRINELNRSLSSLSQVDKLNQDLNKLNARFNQFGEVVDNSSNKVIELSEVMDRKLTIKKREGEIKAFNDRIQRLNAVLLAVGLASLFFGMALRNAAQNAIKSFARTFTTVTEGTALYNATLGKLNASFEYLKFAIMDAFLTSALGQQLIDVLVSLFDFVSGLSPEFLKFLVVGLLAAAVIGFILMMVGQLSLAFLGPLALIELITHHGHVFFKILGVILNTLGHLIIFIALILTIFLAVQAVIKIWQSDMNIFAKIFLTVLVIAAAILVIMLLCRVPITGAIVLVALLIGAIVALGIAMVLYAKEFQLAFLKAIRFIANAIANQIIDRLNGILSIFNKLTGRSYKIEFGGFTGLDSRISSLQAEIDEKRAAKAEQEANTAGSEKGSTIFNIENLMSDNAEKFVTDIKEISQFNSGAGTG